MKATKKCLIFALILCLALCLAACGGSVSGQYRLTGMESDGVAYTEEQLAAYLGEDTIVYLQLNDDGTAVLNIDGDTTDMEYADGQIWPVDDPEDVLNYTLREGRLTLFQDTSMLFFQK